MKSLTKTIGLALSATLLFGVVTSAQQQSSSANDSTAQQQQAPEGRGHKRGKFRRHHRRHHHGAHGRKAFAALNLTDAQKEQMRSIAQQQKQATRQTREELFRLRQAQQPGVEPSAETKARRDELRAELRRAKEQTHTQMLAILTPEQRAQHEQFKQERERRRAERRARFGGAQQTK